MSQGHREQSRRLALDVRQLVWLDKKFETDEYLQTGHIQPWVSVADQPIPDNALLRAEIERMLEAKKGKSDG